MPKIRNLEDFLHLPNAALAANYCTIWTLKEKKETAKIQTSNRIVERTISPRMKLLRSWKTKEEKKLMQKSREKYWRERFDSEALEME